MYINVEFKLLTFKDEIVIFDFERSQNFNQGSTLYIIAK